MHKSLIKSICSEFCEDGCTEWIEFVNLPRRYLFLWQYWIPPISINQQRDAFFFSFFFFSDFFFSLVEWILLNAYKDGCIESMLVLLPFVIIRRHCSDRNDPTTAFLALASSYKPKTLPKPPDLTPSLILSFYFRFWQFSLSILPIKRIAFIRGPSVTQTFPLVGDRNFQFSRSLFIFFLYFPITIFTFDRVHWTRTAAQQPRLHRIKWSSNIKWHVQPVECIQNITIIMHFTKSWVTFLILMKVYQSNTKKCCVCVM